MVQNIFLIRSHGPNLLSENVTFYSFSKYMLSVLTGPIVLWVLRNQGTAWGETAQAALWAHSTACLYVLSCEGWFSFPLDSISVVCEPGLGGRVGTASTVVGRCSRTAAESPVWRWCPGSGSSPPVPLNLAHSPSMWGSPSGKGRSGVVCEDQRNSVVIAGEREGRGQMWIKQMQPSGPGGGGGTSVFTITAP